MVTTNNATEKQIYNEKVDKILQSCYNEEDIHSAYIRFKTFLRGGGLIG
jgi:hypothetical protein